MAVIQAALNNTPSSANTPDPVRSKPTPSRGAKTVALLKGIYMEQVTSSGVGGMVSFDFDSYAVFQDGTISSDLNEAFGDRTARSPKSWGRWQQFIYRNLHAQWSYDRAGTNEAKC